MVEVARPSKVRFPHIYIFSGVMLMSGIDGIRVFVEDSISLFLFDLCISVYDSLCLKERNGNKHVHV